MSGGSFIHLKGVLNANELQSVRSMIAIGRFEDGRATASGAARKIKSNLQLAESPEKMQLSQMLMQTLMRHPVMQRAVMPKSLLPPIISKYTQGMEYGTHVDSPFNGVEYTIRTDVGATLFLSDPKDYGGGELEVMTPAGYQKYKLAAGDAICYPTTQLHRVNPVTSGERIVAVTWLQCAIRDAHQRDIVFQTSEAIAGLEQRDLANTPEHLSLQQVYSNLIRMWAEL